MSYLSSALNDLMGHVSFDLPPDEAQALRQRVMDAAHALDVRVSNLESGGDDEDQADEDQAVTLEEPAPKKTAPRTRK